MMTLCKGWTNNNNNNNNDNSNEGDSNNNIDGTVKNSESQVQANQSMPSSIDEESILET